MRIKHARINGRKIIYGQGTAEELDELNREANFDAALDVLQNIRRTRKGFFGVKESFRVNRKIYGKRKAG